MADRLCSMTSALAAIGGGDGQDLKRLGPLQEWNQQLQVKQSHVNAAMAAVDALEQEYVRRCKRLSALQHELAAEQEAFDRAVASSEVACISSGLRAFNRKQSADLAEWANPVVEVS